MPLITRRSDPGTLKCSLQMISRKRNRKGTFLRILLQGCKHCIFPRHDDANDDDDDVDDYVDIYIMMQCLFVCHEK